MTSPGIKILCCDKKCASHIIGYFPTTCASLWNLGVYLLKTNKGRNQAVEFLKVHKRFFKNLHFLENQSWSRQIPINSMKTDCGFSALSLILRPLVANLPKNSTPHRLLQLNLQVKERMAVRQFCRLKKTISQSKRFVLWSLRKSIGNVDT